MADCYLTYAMDAILWEAIINCNNYNGAITFDLALSGEKKETIAGKRRSQSLL